MAPSAPCEDSSTTVRLKWSSCRTGWASRSCPARLVTFRGVRRSFIGKEGQTGSKLGEPHPGVCQDRGDQRVVQVVFVINNLCYAGRGHDLRAVDAWIV